MIQIGAKNTLKRLDEMLSSAIDGTFEERRYDETELSRLESRWKQYFASSRRSLEKVEKERESIKALVSDISHQTKTPLANILLYAGLLEENAKGEEEKEIAAQILRQTEKLEFLIQSLVKISRLESGILEVVPKAQKVYPLIEDVKEALQTKADAKGIRLSCEGDREISCSYDRKWTYEALHNIVDNAIKYSPKGGSVKLCARKFEFYACVEIRDEGPGISEDERARIFDRFYRGAGVQQEEGVGIGLYLAREIVVRENGYIKVTSRAGGGSIFGVYLPRERY